MKSILFNTAMIRATLDNRKTVTRRPMKPQPASNNDIIYKNQECGEWFISPDNDCFPETKVNPPYSPGDILYVRETWERFECFECENHELSGECPMGKNPDEKEGCWMYRASDEIGGDAKWHPSIHMPREAARIFLRVKNVRVERLQDITVTDLQKEGIMPDNYISQYACCTVANEYFEIFQNLWNTPFKLKDLALYGWNANPWVWVIEFERISKEEAKNGI